MFPNTQMRKSGVYDADINGLRRERLEVTNIHRTSDRTTELMLKIHCNSHKFRPKI